MSVFIFLFVYSAAKANTYISINSGLWTNTTNVWSTDGITPCGCFPGDTLSGDTVTVNHNLSVPNNLIIKALSFLTVNPTGQMNGGFNIVTWNSRIEIFGTINMNKYAQDILSLVNLNPGAILIASNSFNVKDGVITLNGAVVNSGGLDIQTAGTMNLTNAARFFVVSGNAVIDGNLFIDFDCCMQTNGNWKNNATGSITGSGTVNSGGNINNSGFVDLTISWCAQGTGLGMPTPENCPLSDAICNAIILPVELTVFDAEVIDKNLSEIYWETASEHNSSHFIVRKSTNGKDWTAIEIVSAAGNSQEVIKYKIYDYELPFGTTYYSLEQVDMNGRSTLYSPISIVQKDDLEDVVAFPNPLEKGNSLQLRNLSNEATSYTLLNINGNVVFEYDNIVFNNRTSLELSDVERGLYILRITQENNERSIKINIQ